MGREGGREGGGIRGVAAGAGREGSIDGLSTKRGEPAAFTCMASSVPGAAEVGGRRASTQSAMESYGDHSRSPGSKKSMSPADKVHVGRL